MTFFVNTPGVFPVLVSINAAGGTMNYRHDICATYFTSPTVPCMCGTVVTGSTVPAPSPVTDALRVFVGAGAWRVACCAQATQCLSSRATIACTLSRRPLFLLVATRSFRNRTKCVRRGCCRGGHDKRRDGLGVDVTCDFDSQRAILLPARSRRHRHAPLGQFFVTAVAGYS